MIVTAGKDFGLLFDKDNNEIKLAEWANLETGEVYQFKLDKNGNIIRENEKILKEIKYYNAPLRFERFEWSK